MTVHSPQEYVLEMRGIKKHFTGVKALDGVDLRVRPGTVHVLVGENGAGQSMLMKVLSGEHPIDAGEIHFKGARLDRQDTIFQNAKGLVMAAYEVVKLAMNGKPLPKEMRIRFESIVEGNVDKYSKSASSRRPRHHHF